jgi:putative transposase
MEASWIEQKSNDEKRRREMVAMVRRGHSLREVARKFRVSRPTVQRWVNRAKGQRLDRTSFSDLSSAPHRVANRVSIEAERMVLTLRTQLREKSALGEFGAAAIRREMERLDEENIPSLRTIGYILERAGALDYRRRVRRRPPPQGWYLSDVAARLAEIDEFDFVEGLVIKGGIDVEVLNVVSLHGGLCQSWPAHGYDTKLAIEAILQHWKRWGLPDYAQFDNDTRFQGPHQYADTIGRVIKVCLGLGVVPVFAPAREHGLQNAIESFNGNWQEKVWARFEHESLEGLVKRSDRYIEAKLVRNGARIAGAPERRECPVNWAFDAQKKVRGRIIYIRRTNDQGEATVLGHQFAVDERWVHRLVRCEVDIDAKAMRFYALRRSAPEQQPKLREVAYQLPLRYIED